MLEEKTGIGPGLFFCLAYSMFTGYGVLPAPQLAAAYIGANGYWGLIPACFLALLTILAFARLARYFPGQSVLEFLPRLLGRPAGKLLGGAYLLFVLALALWSLGAVAEYMRIHSLARTPAAVLVVMILLADLYLVTKGIEVIARLAAFLFPLSLLITAGNIFISFQNFHLDNIRPILYLEPAKLALGTAHLFNTFLPLGSFLLFAKYLRGRREGHRLLLAAGGLTALYSLLIILAALGRYGAAMTARLAYPYLAMALQSNIPFILQSFGLFISVVFASQYFTSLAGFYFTLAQGTAELLGILDYKRLALIYFPPLVLLVLWIGRGGSVAWQVYFARLRAAGFFFLLGLTAVAMTACFFRRRKREREDGG